MNHLSYLYHNLISTQHLKDKSISIIVLLYNLILTAREGIMGNCHPEKTNVDRGEAEAEIGFRGVTFLDILDILKFKVSIKPML